MYEPLVFFIRKQNCKASQIKLDVITAYKDVVKGKADIVIGVVFHRNNYDNPYIRLSLEGSDSIKQPLRFDKI